MRDATIEVVAVETVASDVDALPPMGYALSKRRTSQPIDAHLQDRLLELFELGNVDRGQKLSTFTMEEYLLREFPWTLVPDRNRIGSWLSTSITKCKRKRDQDIAAAATNG